MHFHIIQLSSTPIDTENYLTESDLYDDEICQLKSDWFGDEIEFTEGEAETIASILKGVATIDHKARTMIFLPKEKVLEKFRAFMKRELAGYLDALEKGHVKDFNIRSAVDQPLDIDELFYIDGYCHTAGSFISDYLNGYVPETLYIGSLLDGHK